MNIFTTIEVVMNLLNLLVQVEPQLEKDVKDILRLIHEMRDNIQKSEGKTT
jgi:predicted ATP-grasp superfamily ATP-dependent carboligase